MRELTLPHYLFVDIILTRCKLSYDDLRDAIMQLDEERLPISVVEQFLNFIPTPEEVGWLLPFTNGKERETLARPDRFLLEMMLIERCEGRLKAMQFRQAFEERLFDLNRVYMNITLRGFGNMECLFYRTRKRSTYKEAIQALKTSKCLHQVLQLILAFGNVMNQNSFRGGAFGFRVTSINRVP